jgi:hypothetical protein
MVRAGPVYVRAPAVRNRAESGVYRSIPAGNVRALWGQHRGQAGPVLVPGVRTAARSCRAHVDGCAGYRAVFLSAFSLHSFHVGNESEVWLVGYRLGLKSQ